MNRHRARGNTARRIPPGNYWAFDPDSRFITWLVCLCLPVDIRTGVWSAHPFYSYCIPLATPAFVSSTCIPPPPSPLPIPKTVTLS